MDLKIPIFQIFQKNVRYVGMQLLVVYQCTQFQVDSSISCPKWVVFVSKILPIYNVIFQMQFFVILRGST